ncbi:adenylyltransferase/cytidyltransferase family protein [Marinomonas sp. 15G1-11]|uniref:Adenylyltransferase/cytidyltransferase family protein n=1 Tax=Marinomonas phaeophyticola TaxID=3004091 RepID=A0ABT4JXT2_9GAMM|nr:adenylyltransferase/cytidyltransferase family protein [Marinomonas sp. 15G1-11]MCZ2723139.1 adenylyltransferase/cytidyltransferase family protein [Marinomonas sp. 15G1-11]
MPFTKQFQYALSLMEQGQLDAAEELLQSLTKQHPKHILIRLYLAQVAITKGEGDGYLDELTSIITHYPHIADSHFVLAQHYRQTGKLIKSAEFFYNALMAKWASENHDVIHEQKFKEKDKINPHFDSGAALHLLWQVLAAFYKAGIYAFPTAGTLLGLERTEKLLPNDKDIDIGIDWLQMPKAIELIKENGWREVSRSYDLINPRCFQHSSGIVIDLCGFGTEEKSGKAISGLWMKNVPFEWNRITYFPAIQLETRPSPSGSIYYLKEPKPFLESLYGEEWKEEDPWFDTIICAKNMPVFSPLARCYAYSRLYAHWGKNNIQKCLRILETLVQKQPNDTFLRKLLTHFQNKLNHTTLTDSPLTSKKTKVLALGYFDLFHIGHMNYLHYAKKQGDHLTVGISPDEFSKITKGYHPILTQSERRQFIESLDFVDQTVLVAARMDDTDNAIEWIQSLEVDLVVCGGNWNNSPAGIH